MPISGGEFQLLLLRPDYHPTLPASLHNSVTVTCLSAQSVRDRARTEGDCAAGLLSTGGGGRAAEEQEEVCLSVRSSPRPTVFLTVRLFVRPSAVFSSVRLPVCPSVCPSLHMSVCLEQMDGQTSIHPSVLYLNDGLFSIFIAINRLS